MANPGLVGVGMDVAVAGSARLGRRARRDAAAVGPFERLVQITRSNDDLLGELAVARRRVARAEAYAVDPRSRGRLGRALVAHARERQAAILDRLRANRREAMAILAGG